ncbi:hypothetical protein SLS63_006483 [Diaporthe eres]|uniref:Uncharacterized protein n=1 Tax=Diaporthe eres TaxID=83184 RepID=A0ABR1P8C3_DIAER
MSTTEADLREQWGNPRDILSLLLLLGGDIVQKAIAQQVGHQVRPFGRYGPAVSVAPVAFSFGWVAYGFSSLLAAFGDMALMPARSIRAPMIVGTRGPYKDEADADVDLKDTEEGLAELASWASGAPQARIPSGPGNEKNQPRWLESMAREDGVPDWLKPVHPQAAAAATAADAKACPSSILTWLSDKMRGTSEKKISEQKKTVRVIGGVHGALIELEKWVPTAGLAMLGVFFPRGLSYNDEAVRDNVHKRFWRQASHTKPWRLKAEIRRSQQYAVGAAVCTRLLRSGCK